MKLNFFISRKKEISECLFSSNSKKIPSDGLTIRITGSAALDLAYVSCGRFDGSFHKNLSLWDIAAGIVLIKEAGGMINDIDLNNIKNIKILATSAEINTKFKEKLGNF